MVLWLGKLSIFEEVLWSHTFPMEGDQEENNIMVGFCYWKGEYTPEV